MANNVKSRLQIAIYCTILATTIVGGLSADTPKISYQLPSDAQVVGYLLQSVNWYRHAAEAQTNLKKNQIADEVWTAYSNLNTAFRQHRSAVALLEAANQSYNAALESYKYGLRNLLDVTAAQRSLAQARSADVFARTQVLTALADLAFTTGDSIKAHKGPSRP